MSRPARQGEERRGRGLGRGLAALLGEQEWHGEAGLGEAGGGASARAARQVPIEFLHPAPGQPRRKFPQEELRALANSIKQKGVLQPILVRPKGDGHFEIVAGERRWRAAQMSGLHQVPVFERDLTDAEALECALVENIQRSDLDPMEEARGYRQLMQRFGHSQEALARLLSKSRAHVANMLRLLKLPVGVQAMLADGRLGVGHARPLIGRSDAGELAARILREGLNVRQVEELTAPAARRPPAGKKLALPHKSADVRQLEQDLADSLGLAVDLRQGARESGRMTISWRSYEQLENVCERLMRPPESGSRLAPARPGRSRR